MSDLPGPLSGLAVLIVEDEFLIAVEAQHVVESLGGAVAALVNSIGAAREHLSANRPDLVILDLGLGGQNGGLLVDELLAGGIPFVVASGFDIRASARLIDRHIIETLVVVQKPYGNDELAAALIRAKGAAAGST
jgi:CheY-like chemotaxis protein